MNCQQIDLIVELSEDEGNDILGVSKSELMKKVIWMNKPLSSNLRTKFRKELNKLSYKKTNAEPHDAPTECFICEECSIVVVFPLN